MNYKTLLGLFGIAVFLFSCSEPVPQGAIVGNVENGKAMFETNCAVCHQKDGKGKTGFAPSINNIDFLAVANDHMIKRFILEGRSGTSMIPFKNNPNVADNIDDLVAYMRSWSNDYSLYKEIPLDHNWESGGDAGNGEALFATYCAACHGDQGQGYAARGSGTGIANASFVSLVPDDYIKQTLLLGRAGTAMKSFDGAKGVASLTNGEMDDLVAFLRTKGEYVMLTGSGSAISSDGGSSSAMAARVFTDPYLFTIFGILIFCVIAMLYIVSLLRTLKAAIAEEKG